MKFKLGHIAFTVKNTEDSIKWYKDKLGFQVVHKYNKLGMEITLLKLGNVRIELFCFGKNTKPMPRYRNDLMGDLHVVGTKHLCIEVESLDESIGELRQKGVEFTTEVDVAGFGGKYIFFKDCNGILIELYQAN